MAEVAQGWYADPAGSGGMRWWDGQRWTDATQPTAVSSPSYQAAEPAQSYSSAPVHGVPAPGYGEQPYGQQPYRQQQYGQPQAGYDDQYGQPAYAGPGTSGSLLRRNRQSAVAIGVSVLLILIALFSNFVLVGLLPIVFTVRAFRAREKLAPVAAVAAAVAVLLALVLFSAR